MPEEWLLFHQNQLMGKVWVDGEQTGPPTPLVDASRSRVRTTKLLDQVFEKMWRDHGSVGLSVVLLQLLVSSQGRPQTVHEVSLKKEVWN